MYAAVSVSLSLHVEEACRIENESGSPAVQKVSTYLMLCFFQFCVRVHLGVVAGGVGCRVCLFVRPRGRLWLVSVLLRFALLCFASLRVGFASVWGTRSCHVTPALGSSHSVIIVTAVVVVFAPLLHVAFAPLFSMSHSRSCRRDPCGVALWGWIGGWGLQHRCFLLPRSRQTLAYLLDALQAGITFSQRYVTRPVEKSPDTLLHLAAVKRIVAIRFHCCCCCCCF